MVRRFRFRGDASGASEVLGSTLLVAITVVMAASLGGLVVNFAKPTPTFHAEVAVVLSSGWDAAWATGNEKIVFTNRGGQPLPTSSTLLLIGIGGASTRFPASGLGGAWADGAFTIGEKYEFVTTIGAAESVSAAIVVATEQGEKVLSATELVPSGATCLQDSTPPTVASWQLAVGESSDDVTVASSGAVKITILAADDCAGVNQGVNPSLFWKIEASAASGSYATVSMARIGLSLWSGTIPSQTWSSHGGKTLFYYVSGMRDTLGNTAGPSTVRTDPIQGTSTTLKYLNCPPTLVKGTVQNCANAQSGSSLEMNLTEGTLTGSTSADYWMTHLVSADDNIAQPFKLLGQPDGQYAVYQKHDKRAKIGFSSAPQGQGTITKVELLFKGYYSIQPGGDPNKNKEVKLKDIVASPCPNAKSYSARTIVLAATDQWYPPIDVTSDRAWTWADIGCLNIEVQAATGEDKIWVYADVAAVRVTASVVNGRVMNVENTFTSVPAGVQQDLQLKYRVSGPDNFHVEVWNGTAWNRRGEILSSAVPVPWSYRLTTQEFLGGAPKIRYIDENPLGTNPTILSLAYARVATS
jgi:hypothetical protein